MGLANRENDVAKNQWLVDNDEHGWRGAGVKDYLRILSDLMNFVCWLIDHLLIDASTDPFYTEHSSLISQTSSDDVNMISFDFQCSLFR